MKKNIKVGVTGHRVMKKEKAIVHLLIMELNRFSKQYNFDTITSPLADGADRIVAKIFVNEFHSSLIAPLPFEKEEYKKDFSEDSKKEFDSYLEQAARVYEVDSIEKNSRNECYLKVGKEVVDKCDILIALWDGRKANGTGGTGDIVDYAKEKKKPILHLNANTLKIKRINFEGLL